MNLQKLIHLREGHRSIINHQLEQIEEAKQDASLLEFHAIFDAINSKISVIQNLDEKILNQTDIADIEQELFASDKFSLSLDIKLRQLRAFVDGQQNVVTPAETATVEIPQQNASPVNSITLEQMDSLPRQSSIVSTSSQYCRLPKVSIPTFSGDILKWQTFWDSFESTVHMNASLSEVQKFNYLQSQLEGDAARTIEGFPLTNSNYIKAVDMLKERFGQTHKIIHAYMQALLQLPAPRNEVTSIREFYDRMESYIRGLESLGQKQDAYGSLLVPVIIDKLPGEIRKQLARGNRDGYWILAQLREAILTEIRVLETGNQSNTPSGGMYETASLFMTNVKDHYQSNHSQKYAASNRRKGRIQCTFCDQPHSSNACSKVTDYDTRHAIVKQKKLCYNCLGNHLVSKCLSKRRCTHCSRKHHSSICSDQQSNVDTTTPRQNVPVISVIHEDSPILHATTTTSPHQPHVLLKTAVAPVSSESRTMDANILFDEGAQKSFVSDELAKRLNIVPTGIAVVNLATFGDNSKRIQHLETATVFVVTQTCERIPVHVLIVPLIAIPLNRKCNRSAKDLPYLRSLQMAHPVTDDESFEISLLIGADFYWQFVQDRVIRGDGPTAVQSKLGYLLSGPLSENTCHQEDHVQTITTAHIQSDCDIERFWSLESMGISDQSDDIKKATEALQTYQDEGIRFEDNRYIAHLPWKSDHPPLPSNFYVTKKRTESAIRRLSQEPEILMKYGAIMREQEKRGFIERVPTTEVNNTPVHYIPHHAVRKDSATTPVRIVYDCSCREKQNSPSLNDCLRSTPPEINDLTSLIMCFRYHRYGVSTDIEKAFLHVGLDVQDRDFTRFFWLSDPANPRSPLVTYRFKTVLFGATCSPFILNATLLKHINKNKHLPAADILERDLYVDNILSSFDQESDLQQYFRESRDLMARAGFNLRSWMSNSERLKNMAAIDGFLDSDTTVKVLGLMWDTNTDRLLFKRQTYVSEKCTKRLILQQSSRIFDPLGLLSPVTVRAKLMMQDLWKQKYDWDTPLPRDIQHDWKTLAEDLSLATEITFSRRYFHISECHSSADNKLHVFVDASKKSYGATVYLCNGDNTSLVIAKNRVAPLKQITRPRLELMAALLGARLGHHVKESMNIDNVTYWSDSQIVLHWLHTTKPLQRFVHNRVQEIHTIITESTWKYCPTGDNPADLLTRGITTTQLKDAHLWWKGPKWLTAEHQWPVWNITAHANSLLAEEHEIEETSGTSTSRSPNNRHEQANSSISQIMDTNRFGSYKKLVRTTAYIQRFVTNCRVPKNVRVNGPVTVSQFRDAEQMWIRDCQTSTYQEEIENISSKANRLPLVRQLRLFLDTDGILRCGGRIHNAPVDIQTKFPALLPAKHPLTRLLVLDAHIDQLHSGINSTVTYLRQKFWIPTIRQCVKTVIRKCVTCRKVIGKPYSAPDPPPLMKYRVEDAEPFHVTGVDFTGALHVKTFHGREHKVYLCLFTCASTRAVYLEVTPDLSEESFLQAFRRFTSRKSLPSLMISDNGTTFTAAASSLKRLAESPTLLQELSNRGTTWTFIPNRAPWYGGFWERLIGLTKTALKKTLGRAFISFEMMRTIVTEIEAILNDRPLTYVTSDFDVTEILTPAHLLYGRKIKTLPYADVTQKTCNSATGNRADVLKRANQQKTIIDHFRGRWKTEYLTALREHHRTSGNNQQSIIVGDVVQVHDDVLPRARWRLAVVDKLCRGNDGLVRSALVRIGNSVSNRPITKLYPLEVCEKR